MSQTPQNGKALKQASEIKPFSRSAQKLDSVKPEYSQFRKFGEYAGPEGPKESIWGGSPCKYYNSFTFS